MRFNTGFLQQFTKVSLPAKDIAAKMTAAGFEIAGVTEEAGDARFEVELTSNRADMLSVAGVACELGAVVGSAVTIEDVAPKSTAADVSAAIHVHVVDIKDCPYYSARVITGVTVKDSPQWLKDLLSANGIEPINNIVDITNYCMLKWGAPLHAFDKAALTGGITVRRAHKGEKLFCLDGKERALETEDIVIADDAKATALAGVMGGEMTKIQSYTKAVVLESALFAPVRIRQTRKMLGMNTDSSYRFERFIYPPYAKNAGIEAANLICELAGGTLSAETVVGVMPQLTGATIAVDANALRAYVGTEIPTAEIVGILERLSCRVEKNGDALTVSVPAYRQDLSIKQDIYEEVIRIYGFDKIPVRLPVIAEKHFGDGRFELKCSLRQKMIALGFKEAVTFNIVDNAHPLRSPEKKPVIIANPLKAPENELRTSVYQPLIDSVAHNVRQKRSEIHLFEIAHVFEMAGEVATEQEVLGFVSHAQTREEFPIFKAKVEEFVRGSGLADAKREPAQHGHFAVCEKFVKDGVLCGCYGILAREYADAMDVKEVFIAGFFVDALMRFKKRPTYAKINYLPSSSRDISILAAAQVSYADIDAAVRAHVGELLADLEVVDTYRGKNIPAGHTAFTLRVTYQHAERTLENEDVDRAQFALRDKLAAMSGVALR